jgi:hypothetical protein
MKYELRHKDRIVALMELDHNIITDIKEIYEKDRLPVKYAEETPLNIRHLNGWLSQRGIPAGRENYEKLLEAYKVDSSRELTVLSHGLNCTDHYWICGAGEQKTWEDVNFFDNSFSGSTGAVIFKGIKNEFYGHPDFSSNGHLKKTWIIRNGERMLYKGGSGDTGQEPFNEYIASYIADCLGLDHVPYTLSSIDGEVYSRCPCMINKDTELMDSSRVFLYGNGRGGRYNDYIKTCEDHGIKDAREKTDKMIGFDYLIRNTDRNSGNYGVIRDAGTLEWLDIAPLFDHGNSLWHNAAENKNINAEAESGCRSFLGTNEENTGLINKTGWFDASRLKDAGQKIYETLKDNKNMSGERIRKISETFEKRIKNFEHSLANKNPA